MKQFTLYFLEIFIPILLTTCRKRNFVVLVCNSHKEPFELSKFDCFNLKDTMSFLKNSLQLNFILRNTILTLNL